MRRYGSFGAMAPSFEENKKIMIQGCQDLPPQVRYKVMLGKWLPGVKGFPRQAELLFDGAYSEL